MGQILEGWVKSKLKLGLGLSLATNKAKVYDAKTKVSSP
jgi:hypothetical protein